MEDSNKPSLWDITVVVAAGSDNAGCVLGTFAIGVGWIGGYFGIAEGICNMDEKRLFIASGITAAGWVINFFAYRLYQCRLADIDRSNGEHFLRLSNRVFYLKMTLALLTGLVSSVVPSYGQILGKRIHPECYKSLPINSPFSKIV